MDSWPRVGRAGGLIGCVADYEAAAGKPLVPGGAPCCSFNAVLGLIIRIACLASVAGLLVAGLALAGSGFMVMVPALLLLVPLLLGRYIGERRLEKVRRSLALRRLRPAGSTVPNAARRGHASLSRGGCLIATSIAVRPPPFLA